MKTFVRANSTKSSTATGYDVLPAGTFVIPDGQPGVCKVRYNQGGTLFVPWGYVGGVQCDPDMRKNPFSMPIQGHWLTASECSAVIYTAATARIG